MAGGPSATGVARAGWLGRGTCRRAGLFASAAGLAPPPMEPLLRLRLHSAGVVDGRATPSTTHPASAVSLTPARPIDDEHPLPHQALIGSLPVYAARLPRGDLLLPGMIHCRRRPRGGLLTTQQVRGRPGSPPVHDGNVRISRPPDGQSTARRPGLHQIGRAHGVAARRLAAGSRDRGERACHMRLCARRGSRQAAQASEGLQTVWQADAKIGSHPISAATHHPQPESGSSYTKQPASRGRTIHSHTIMTLKHCPSFSAPVARQGKAYTHTLPTPPVATVAAVRRSPSPALKTWT